MKLQRRNKESLVFQLGPQEKALLFEMIKLYPLVPAGHHRLSKTAESQSEENQRLLDESLAEQRAFNRRAVEALLNEPGRFRSSGKNFLLKLIPTEMEWLLQVLNDIRIGSWLALGEPELDTPPQIESENYRYIVALQVCGAFEGVLLAACGETESPEWLE